jgi:acyl-CoA synthetase (AMP-forming)/AMP-acid ligase II
MLRSCLSASSSLRAVGPKILRQGALRNYAAPLTGLMQNHQLLVSNILKFAEEHHGKTEIVSKTVEGPIHRYTYADAAARSRQLANVLVSLGIGAGDTVTTIAWNGFRHFELYYAVSGSGAIIHTVNPRLSPQQIVYIINHGDGKALFFELNLLPAVEKLAPALKAIKHFILMTDEQHMPKSTTIPNLLCYEKLMKPASSSFQWPKLDENTASSLCYTSGTTGDPKGVVYSHRSTVLHSYAIALPDSINLSAADAVFPVVPMFHVNAWGLPYACPMVGAKLVLPGSHLDGASVYELIKNEKVTMAAGVPTVWLGLLQHMAKNNLTLPDLKRTVIGGAAAPRAMLETFEKKYNVPVVHAWGMTETSPVGLVCTMKPKHASLTFDQQLQLKGKQGRPIFGVEFSIVDDDGKEIPRDGKTMGHLRIRGPWITRAYFKKGTANIDQDNWFDTGDVVTMDEDSYVFIADRKKDLVKSGGEWISTPELEDHTMSHPAVHQVAVVGFPHPKFDERPVAFVVLKEGQKATKQEIIDHLRSRVAHYWLPDDVLFVKELPHTATGKISKKDLREQFKDYKLPTA